MGKKVLFQIGIEESDNGGESKMHIFIEKSIPPPVMCNYLAKGIQMVCSNTIMDDIDKASKKPNLWLPKSDIAKLS